MTAYDSKRLIAILLMIFGVACVIAITLSWNVPNIILLGVLLLNFGYNLLREAELDEIKPSQ
jgi:uncharacterized membrane protein